MKNKKLVMIPGPTPVHRSIQDQMGRETCSFKDPAFVQDFKDVLKDLQDLFRVDGEAFVVAGSGTMAMEMALANVTSRDDNVLIVSNGYFGDRYKEICERKGLNVDVLSAEWGETITPEAIDAQLKTKKYAAMTVTHVDTSTGVRAPIKAIGQVIEHYPETVYIVDGVCASAAEREYVDDYNIDILFTASQKAFGVPPGLAILWAGQKALARRKSLGTIPEYYIDFEKWLPIMHEPSNYFGTPPVNLIWALKQSIELIKDEGIEKRYDRHLEDARFIQQALQDMGFDILADEDCRATTLSNVLYPEGVDDENFRQVLAEEGVVVAGGLGDYAGKLFRLGHMGHIDQHIIASTLAAIRRTLKRVGN